MKFSNLCLFPITGGGINKDMRDFLSQDFPNNDEVDIDLQDATRDNLYARTVPCTYFIVQVTCTKT
jgi:hypothetical protein